MDTPVEAPPARRSFALAVSAGALALLLLVVAVAAVQVATRFAAGSPPRAGIGPALGLPGMVAVTIAGFGPTLVGVIGLRLTDAGVLYWSLRGHRLLRWSEVRYLAREGPWSKYSLVADHTACHIYPQWFSEPGRVGDWLASRVPADALQPSPAARARLLRSEIGDGRLPVGFGFSLLACMSSVIVEGYLTTALAALAGGLAGLAWGQRRLDLPADIRHLQPRWIGLTVSAPYFALMAVGLVAAPAAAEGLSAVVLAFAGGVFTTSLLYLGAERWYVARRLDELGERALSARPGVHGWF